jgi:hypothetical protein
MIFSQPKKKPLLKLAANLPIVISSPQRLFVFDTVSVRVSVTTLQIELQTINSSMANCYLKVNAGALVGFYEKAFIYLPEYKPPINKTAELHYFYAEWFKSQPPIFFDKQIYSVEKIENFILEI